MPNVTREGNIEQVNSPRHGDQGDRLPKPRVFTPLRLTVAVSREVGARGGSIAQRVGKKLGWQVYTQEHLGYLAGDETAVSQLRAELTSEARQWVSSQLHQTGTGGLQQSDAFLTELILMLAAQGEVILVGRGAGYHLPKSTTLHVRIVAPLEDRINYMSEWLRMTREEAALEVQQRDQRRKAFLAERYGRTGEMYDYDLLLNSGLLGEELSARLIVQATEGKMELSKRVE
jgi:hypothetical protein